MPLRSYLLLRLDSSLDRDGVVRVVRELEEIPQVSFAEPVVGAYDLVVSAEGGESPQQLVGKVAIVEGVRAVELLRVNPIPARERMWRNLSQLPLVRPE